MIIPFFIPHAACPHRCVFCDQRLIAGTQAGPEPRVIAATISRFLASERPERPAQVAFYGGTFTALPPERQQSYLAPVQPFIASGAVHNIRISTRPDAVDTEALSLLRRHHVTTVEIGAQSLDDEVLRRSGRGHGSEDVVRSVQKLKQAGFTVGVQLMPGLPGDSPGRFRETVQRTVALAPDLVRIYPALVIRGTALEEMYRSGVFAPLSLEDAVAWCTGALNAFDRAGIAVIRVGLQPTSELERQGTVVAGPYHPAFRQLVESERFLVKMRELMQQGAEPVFLVHPDDLSTAIGQQKRNLRSLRSAFGNSAVVLPDQRVPRHSVELAGQGPEHRKPSCASGRDGL